MGSDSSAPIKQGRPVNHTRDDRKKVGKPRHHCKLKGQRDALPLVASIEREGQGGRVKGRCKMS